MSRPELSHRDPDQPVDPNQPVDPRHPVDPNRPDQPADASPPPEGKAAAPAGAAVTDAGARPGRRLHPGELLDTGVGRNLGLVAVLAVLCVIGVATASTFATTANLLTILTSASIIGVITVGATMVIIRSGIDLSVGKVMALASVWSTTVATQSYGPVVMVLCALAVGAGAGLVNGLLIAYGRIVPFIATLAMLISAQGLAEQISGKRSQIVTDPTIAAIASTRLLGIPLLVYLFALVVAVGWVVLNRTTFGRRTFAIGGNPEAARLAGLDVRRHTVLLYVVSGLCCGIAAVMITSLTTTGSSTHGTLYELDAIAAVDHWRDAAVRRPRHPDRLDPRRAGVHHHHQPVRAQQPGDRGPEHRQGRDHRRRRALPGPRPTDQPLSVFQARAQRTNP
jgi:ribose transport system permease protein